MRRLFSFVALFCAFAGSMVAGVISDVNSKIAAIKGANHIDITAMASAKVPEVTGCEMTMLSADGFKEASAIAATLPEDLLLIDSSDDGESTLILMEKNEATNQCEMLILIHSDESAAVFMTGDTKTILSNMHIGN